MKTFEYRTISGPRSRRVSSLGPTKKILTNAEMPFNQMPVLDVDGKKIPQSLAIARFLAKQYGEGLR